MAADNPTNNNPYPIPKKNSNRNRRSSKNAGTRRNGPARLYSKLMFSGVVTDTVKSRGAAVTVFIPDRSYRNDRKTLVSPYPVYATFRNGKSGESYILVTIRPVIRLDSTPDRFSTQEKECPPNLRGNFPLEVNFAARRSS